MKALILMTTLSMGVSACDSSNLSTINNNEMTATNTIVGNWKTTEKTAVTTPFGTVWTLNSAEFGADGKTLTGEFTKEDGSPMTEHLGYEFVKNYQSTGKDAVLMRNNYFKDLVVVFTVEKLTATELELKAVPNQNAGPLNFGSGVLKFKRLK